MKYPKSGLHPQSLHAQLDFSGLFVDGDNPYLALFAHPDEIHRIPHVRVGNLRYVHEPVVLEPDIDERPEGHDVPDRSGDDVPGLEGFDGYFFPDLGMAASNSRIRPDGFVGFSDEFDGAPGRLGIEGSEPGFEFCEIVRSNALLDDKIRELVLFRMDIRIVEPFLAFGNPQEPDRLFVGLFREDFLELFPGFVRTVVVDFFRGALVKTGYVIQDVHGGEVHVDPDPVHGVLDGEPEPFLELLFGDIVLIHAHADAAYRDFHEFGQGIDIPSGNRYRPTVGNVEVREFLLGDGRGAIDGRAGFVHEEHGFFHGFPYQFDGGFRSGPVSDDDDPHVVFRFQFSDDFDGLVFLVEENLCEFDRIPEFVEHCDFATGPVSGVDGEHLLPVFRLGHQEISEILLEGPDGFVLGPFRERSADFRLDGFEERRVAFFHGLLEFRDERSSGERPFYQVVGLVVLFEFYPEYPEIFAPVEREDLVGLDPGNHRGKVGVNVEFAHFSPGFLIEFLEHFLAFHFGSHFAFRREMLSLRIADFGVGTDFRGDDFDGSFDDFLTGVGLQKARGHGKAPVQPDGVGNGLKSLFDSEHGLGFLFEAVGRVNVLDLLEGFRELDIAPEFGREAALFLDAVQGGHFCLVEVPLPFVEIDDVADLVLVEFSRPFLPVPRDKRNGSALGHEREHGFYLAGLECEFVLDDSDIVRFLHGSMGSEKSTLGDNAIFSTRKFRRVLPPYRKQPNLEQDREARYPEQPFEIPEHENQHADDDVRQKERHASDGRIQADYCGQELDVEIDQKVREREEQHRYSHERGDAYPVPH